MYKNIFGKINYFLLSVSGGVIAVYLWRLRSLPDCSYWQIVLPVSFLSFPVIHLLFDFSSPMPFSLKKSAEILCQSSMLILIAALPHPSLAFQHAFGAAFILINIARALITLLPLCSAMIHAGSGQEMRRIERRCFPAVFTALSVLSLWTGWVERPAGDEPHYLLIARSLIQDRDLDLENNYEQAWQEGFYEERIFPQQHQVEEITIPKKNVGFPLLLIPAYFIGKYYGALIFMNLFSALLWLTLFRISFKLSASISAALIIASFACFSSPVMNYSSLIYPEIPAAWFLLLQANAALPVSKKTPRSFLYSVFITVILTFIKFRYFLIAGPLLLIQLAAQLKTSGRKIKKLLVVIFLILPVSFAILIFSFKHVLMLMVLRILEIIKLLADIPPPARGFFGMFFDQSIGIFLINPAVPLFFFLMLFLALKKNKSALTMLPGIFFYLAAFSVTRFWGGGWSFPGRFLTVLIPLIALPAAEFYKKIRSNPSKKSLITVILLWTSVWCGFITLISLIYPRFFYFWSDTSEAGSRLLRFIGHRCGVDLVRWFPAINHHFLVNFFWFALYVSVAFILAFFSLRKAGRFFRSKWFRFSLPLFFIVLLSVAVTRPIRHIEPENRLFRQENFRPVKNGWELSANQNFRFRSELARGPFVFEMKYRISQSPLGKTGIKIFSDSQELDQIPLRNDSERIIKIIHAQKSGEQELSIRFLSSSPVTVLLIDFIHVYPYSPFENRFYRITATAAELFRLKEKMHFFHKEACLYNPFSLKTGVKAFYSALHNDSPEFLIFLIEQFGEELLIRLPSEAKHNALVTLQRKSADWAAIHDLNRHLLRFGDRPRRKISEFMETAYVSNNRHSILSIYPAFFQKARHRYIYAWALRGAGDPKQADEELRQLLETFPGYFPALSDLADSLLIRGLDEGEILNRQLNRSRQFVIEAEKMEHETGKEFPDGWELTTNGKIAAWVALPAGTYKITCTARGSHAQWIWPLCLIKMNGENIWEFSADSYIWKNYAITRFLDSGAYLLELFFTNDFYYPKDDEDRNLIINRIVFEYLPE